MEDSRFSYCNRLLCSPTDAVSHMAMLMAYALGNTACTSVLLHHYHLSSPFNILPDANFCKSHSHDREESFDKVIHFFFTVLARRKYYEGMGKAIIVEKKFVLSSCQLIYSSPNSSCGALLSVRSRLYMSFP